MRRIKKCLVVGLMLLSTAIATPSLDVSAHGPGARELSGRSAVGCNEGNDQRIKFEVPEIGDSGFPVEQDGQLHKTQVIDEDERPHRGNGRQVINDILDRFDQDDESDSDEDDDDGDDINRLRGHKDEQKAGENDLLDNLLNGAGGNNLADLFNGRGKGNNRLLNDISELFSGKGNMNRQRLEDLLGDIGKGNGQIEQAIGDLLRGKNDGRGRGGNNAELIEAIESMLLGGDRKGRQNATTTTPALETTASAITTNIIDDDLPGISFIFPGEETTTAEAAITTSRPGHMVGGNTTTVAPIETGSPIHLTSSTAPIDSAISASDSHVAETPTLVSTVTSTIVAGNGTLSSTEVVHPPSVSAYETTSSTHTFPVPGTTTSLGASDTTSTAAGKTISGITVIAGDGANTTSGLDSIQHVTSTLTTTVEITVIAPTDSPAAINTANPHPAPPLSSEPIGLLTTTHPAATPTIAIGSSSVHVTISSSTPSETALAAPPAFVPQADDCNCACMCPPEAFPAVAPQAPPPPISFESMLPPPLPPSTTLQTVVSSAISETSSVPGLQLDPSLVSSPEAAAPTSSGVGAESQVEENVPAATEAPAPAPAQGPMELPFDLSTVVFESVVTVNLGLRARATEGL